LPCVSVWASEPGLSLGQVACAEKSNEITAIPELLLLVDIKGAIITIDAMGAQKAIAAEIIDGGADYVLALKGNQEALIAVVTSLCVRDGKQTAEVRDSISSMSLDVKRLARAVRGHWGIANGCHWVLAMTYREDESRIPEEAWRENFAWWNRFTLSLLKQHPDRTSIAMKRRSCGWDENDLLQVLTGSTS
jgi:predicted transposase YbfD/YdcC